MFLAGQISFMLQFYCRKPISRRQGSPCVSVGRRKADKFLFDLKNISRWLCLCKIPAVLRTPLSLLPLSLTCAHSNTCHLAFIGCNTACFVWIWHRHWQVCASQPAIRGAERFGRVCSWGSASSFLADGETFTCVWLTLHGWYGVIPLALLIFWSVSPVNWTKSM